MKEPPPTALLLATLFLVLGLGYIVASDWLQPLNPSTLALTATPLLPAERTPAGDPTSPSQFAVTPAEPVTLDCEDLEQIITVQESFVQIQTRNCPDPEGTKGSWNLQIRQGQTELMTWDFGNGRWVSEFVRLSPGSHEFELIATSVRRPEVRWTGRARVRR